jgi:hypothetical protein
MALTVQSLNAAYYARDQITAANLAQEGIEVVRMIRDANILSSATGGSAQLFDNIPISSGSIFYVDGTQVSLADMSKVIWACSATCDPLKSNGKLYGYQSGWSNSNFTRTMSAKVIDNGTGGADEEIRVTSTVSWQTSSFHQRSVTITENLYNWVAPNSGT